MSWDQSGFVTRAITPRYLARSVLVSRATMVGSQAKVTSEERHEGALRIGARVSAYEIERHIGTGGMGWVYAAKHLLDDRRVALKVLREDQLQQERAVDRMMREAQILATVNHGGIPQFFECGLLADGRPWITMELIEGTPLSLRIAEGPIEHEAVIDFVGGVAGVLAAAHQRGVTHRDLKPDNILLTPTDEASTVRVIDWGIAHHLQGARYTHHDEAIGTPTYMAPEQARGGPTDGYCDVYGLGVVAYQALSGRPPFVGSTSVEILVQHLNRPVPSLAPRCPDAPFGLIELVEQMLAKSYDERPSAADVQMRLAMLRSETASPGYMFYAVDGCADGTAPRPRLEIDVDLDEPPTVQLRPALPPANTK